MYDLYYHFYAEGEDFIQTVMELQFTPTELERCMGVRIRDDTAVEDTEVFLVIVDSSDPVSFTTESVTVSILDDQDSKFVLIIFLSCIFECS